MMKSLEQKRSGKKFVGKKMGRTHVSHVLVLSSQLSRSFVFTDPALSRLSLFDAPRANSSRTHFFTNFKEIKGLSKDFRAALLRSILKCPRLNGIDLCWKYRRVNATAKVIVHAIPMWPASVLPAILNQSVQKIMIFCLWFSVYFSHHDQSGAIECNIFFLDTRLIFNAIFTNFLQFCITSNNIIIF